MTDRKWSSRQNRTQQDAFVQMVRAGDFKFTADQKAEHTGRVVVEFERRQPNGKVAPSGIATATKSQWVVAFGSRSVVLPVEEARSLVKRAQDEGLTRWAGDGGASHIAQLPLAWLVGSAEAAPHDEQLRLDR